MTSHIQMMLVQRTSSKRFGSVPCSWPEALDPRFCCPNAAHQVISEKHEQAEVGQQNWAGYDVEIQQSRPRILQKALPLRGLAGLADSGRNVPLCDFCRQELHDHGDSNNGPRHTPRESSIPFEFRVLDASNGSTRLRLMCRLRFGARMHRNLDQRSKLIDVSQHMVDRKQNCRINAPLRHQLGHKLTKSGPLFFSCDQRDVEGHQHQNGADSHGPESLEHPFLRNS